MGTNPFRGQRAVHPLTSEDIGSAATRLSASVQLDGPDHRADEHGHGATGPHPVRSSLGSPRDNTHRLPGETAFFRWNGRERRRCGTCPGWARATASFRAATTLIVHLAFRAVPAVARVLYRTRFGLRLRAAAENPQSVHTAGISVVGLRDLALLCHGVACGVAGTYLSLAQSVGFITT